MSVPCVIFDRSDQCYRLVHVCFSADAPGRGAEAAKVNAGATILGRTALDDRLRRAAHVRAERGQCPHQSNSDRIAVAERNDSLCPEADMAVSVRCDPSHCSSVHGRDSGSSLLR
jgi:hypothetical protein